MSKPENRLNTSAPVALRDVSIERNNIYPLKSIRTRTKYSDEPTAILYRTVRELVLLYFLKIRSNVIFISRKNLTFHGKSFGG